MSRRLPFKPRIGGAARRELIERVAAEAFAEKGYGGVSLDELAGMAGISKATLYDHFASKRELYRELVAGAAAEMLVFMRERVETVEGSARERMRSALDAFFEFVQARPFAWRMLFREAPRDTGMANGGRLVQEGATANVTALLVDMVGTDALVGEGARSEFRLVLVAEMLKWSQYGLAVWWREHPEAPRDVLVDGLMEFLWPGLEALL